MAEKLGFIGGGNMAQAMLGGLLAKGAQAADLVVVEPAEAARAALRAEHGISATPEPHSGLADCSAIVLAVKPQQMRAAAASLRVHLHGQLVISIAAGIRVSDLARWLGGYVNLARAMPNTPALIHAGITGLYAMGGVSQSDRERAGQLLGVVGGVVWVDQEESLDAITAISGSGPAYVFYFIEALTRAGEALGLSSADANRLAITTFTGASQLADTSGEPVAALRAKVTSKGGTTERALAVLEITDVQAHVIRAVKAAAARSAELGVELGKDSGGL